MRNPTIVTLLLVILILSCFSAPSAQDGRLTLVIKNSSGRDFHRVHISWSRDKDWGPNILQAVLRPGASVVRRGMVPAEYDMLLVDANQRPCTIRNLQIYNDTTLTLTDDLLSTRCT
jgi:hypothetical protein